MTKEQKFLLLVVLIVAGASVTYYYKHTEVAPPTAETSVVTTETGNTATTGTTPPSATATNTPPTTTKPPVRSFSTDVTYPVPEEGRETIHVTVSLSAGTIEDITFSYDTPTKRESKERIGSFERAFQAMSFKGKKLSEISLSRLGGSSLTTHAFMEAIGKLNKEASNG